MTNPSPRPALRKAEDADVHPAAPRPARSPRAPRSTASRSSAAPRAAAAPPAVSAVVDPEPETPPVPKRRRRAFSGSTSDAVLVPDSESPAETPERPELPGNLMGGKTVAVEVHLPKKLRKAAKDEAKARGLDLDAVVADLLHEWLTRT